MTEGQAFSHDAAETELTEELAIAKIKTALKKAEADFNPANLQSALEITDKVGGFDNEAAIEPWVQFCKKHKSKVFTALDGSKSPKKHAKLLGMVTDYFIKSGTKITPQKDYEEFLKKDEELKKTING